MTTTGQRIAAKRKELGLSQEALGEKLGVSRQSIYKWESDTSLPEIEKLISLSRLFSVSIGWLLGVEENSENQEKLLEDVLARYQPSKASPRSKWLTGGLAVLCGAALISVISLNAQVQDIQTQVQHLSTQYNHIYTQLTNQTNVLTYRIEEILSAQNHLTADHSTKLLRTSPPDNTAAFLVQVVPKTLTEGMEVLFLIDTGNGVEEFPVSPDEHMTFTKEVTCELTDSINISVVFLVDGTRQTQLLDTYTGLYWDSLQPYRPKFNRYGELAGKTVGADGLFHFDTETFTVCTPDIPTETLYVALFQNQKFVCYSDWIAGKGIIAGQVRGLLTEPDSEYTFLFGELALDIPQGDTITIAAFYTDEYGRVGVEPLIPSYVRDGNILNFVSGDLHYLYDVSSYEF